MALPVRFDYEGRALYIEWDDGQRSLIPFDLLRRACPCAECSGEFEFRGRFATKPELEPGEDELADIALVGNYGLNVIWANGHSTGIYTYERLRELGGATTTPDK